MIKIERPHTSSGDMTKDRGNKTMVADDDVVMHTDNEVVEEVKKQPEMEEARRLGSRLRTLLRLPKAHKWACYEWFYANIDRTLLAGENDFCTYLRESFPNLKTRKLTRTEWCKVRRLMGKPRRCSQAFLAEERNLLNLKRQKIRQLQQQKVVDIAYYRDLPEQIPLSLVIGTRVTALLHEEPNDGLYTGVIDAVDTANHGYRITFDKEEIGTQTVPDFEVVSNSPPEFLPLNSFQTRIKPRMPILKSPKFLEILGNQVVRALGNRSSDAIQQSPLPATTNDDSSSGQYPMKLLALVVKVSKILALKKKRIYELKSMNDEVERLHSLDQVVPVELKRSYASNIMDIEKLNSDLDDHLKAIHLFSNEFPIDISCIANPESIKQECQANAKEIVDLTLPDYEVSNDKSLETITHMMTLMYLLKKVSENEDNALQLKALDDTVQDHKSKLSSSNIAGYEDNVEIHINYIKSSINYSRS